MLTTIITKYLTYFIYKSQIVFLLKSGYIQVVERRMLDADYLGSPLTVSISQNSPNTWS